MMPNNQRVHRYVYMYIVWKANRLYSYRNAFKSNTIYLSCSVRTRFGLCMCIYSINAELTGNHLTNLRSNHYSVAPLSAGKFI